MRDGQGRADRTRPRFFAIRHETLLQDKPSEASLSQPSGDARELRRPAETSGALSGWTLDADNTAERSLPIDGATVLISGQGLAPGLELQLDGEAVMADANGKFVRERILPPGPHEMRYEGLRADGSRTAGGQVIDVPTDRFFLVALADATLGYGVRQGDIEAIADPDDHPDGLYADGRLAFFLKGRIKGSTLLTAQGDSGEEPVDQIFNRMDVKDPRQVFRRLDPDKYYPVYGDASTSRMDVDTQGKLFLRLEGPQFSALWGDYQTGFGDTVLAGYDRALYGAKLDWRSAQAGPDGQRAGNASAFASEALNAHGHDELRSDQGMVAYLSQADLVVGSEQLRVEARDPTTGQVTYSVPLEPGSDYQMDWVAGRVLLARPLAQSLPAGSIVQSLPGGGEPIYLVVDYEYQPQFGDVDEGTVGLRASQWLLPADSAANLKLGVTAVREGRAEVDPYALVGTDAELHLGAGTKLWGEAAGSQRAQGPAQFSSDGGLTYQAMPVSDAAQVALAQRLSVDSDLGGWMKERLGGAHLSGTYQNSDAGYSANGQGSSYGRQDLGGSLRLGGDKLYTELDSAHSQTLGLSRSDINTLSAGGALGRAWTMTGSLKDQDVGDAGYDDLQDLLGSLRLDWRPDSRWSFYGSQQATLIRSAATPENDLSTLGSRLRLTRALTADLSASTGDLGDSARLGLDDAVSEDAQLYGAIEQRDDPWVGRTYDSTQGVRWSLGQRWKTYAENQFNLGEMEQGQSQNFGLSYAPAAAWTFSVDAGRGHLVRNADDPTLTYVDRLDRSDNVGSQRRLRHRPLRTATPSGLGATFKVAGRAGELARPIQHRARDL